MSTKFTDINKQIDVHLERTKGDKNFIDSAALLGISKKKA